MCVCMCAVVLQAGRRAGKMDPPLRGSPEMLLLLMSTHVSSVCLSQPSGRSPLRSFCASESRGEAK